MTDRAFVADRPGFVPAGASGCAGAALSVEITHTGDPGPVGCALMFSISMTTRDPYARLARGCRPRGCRAPARRVHGRRVRYVIGDEPGQVNGMRWPRTRHLR
ncbi:tryptophan biosynthesis modulator TrpM [Streptomyces europaeiscabiei]|uniref:tryptophan biosynthesis modulator TrpM n=1 Tax=Streptomyces europaeiscabiei TaxID=146819 RepID=UPI0029AEEEB5|nr:tryptophan synthase subunit(beta) [Streptomyces europaeiscabiei]WUD32058.1 tryptophan synthase subunit(beta) [Streptomyces europaeiscabiei]